MGHVAVGSGGDRLIGHVCHICKGQSVRFGDGRLFLQMVHTSSMRTDVDWYIGTVYTRIHFLIQRSGGGGGV